MISNQTSKTKCTLRNREKTVISAVKQAAVPHDLTDTGKHVTASPCTAEGDVIDFLVMGNQLGLHMTRHHVHTPQHLTRLWAEKLNTLWVCYDTTSHCVHTPQHLYGHIITSLHVHMPQHLTHLWAEKLHTLWVCYDITSHCVHTPKHLYGHIMTLRHVHTPQHLTHLWAEKLNTLWVCYDMTSHCVHKPNTRSVCGQ